MGSRAHRRSRPEDSPIALPPRSTLTATLLLLIALPISAPGQTQDARDFNAGPAAGQPAGQRSSPSSTAGCGVQRVTTLPGSHGFAGDYIETIANDPASPATLYAITADLSSAILPRNRALYLSKSTNGGGEWTEVARIEPRYFDASIGEGIRNGLAVSPGAASFVLTTQRGAFEILPQPNTYQPLIRPIRGPVVPATPPRLPIAKHPGDPVHAGPALITADGRHLLLGYGYFDLDPKLFLYRRADSTRADAGSPAAPGTDSATISTMTAGISSSNDSASNSAWVEEAQLTGLPTGLDILSMQFDDPANPNPAYLYVGTGDQVFLYHLHAHRWSIVEGVGPDSAIHGMCVTGGLHLAACWGVYNPTGPGTVRRVLNPSFLIHRSSDEAGNNVRAYSIDVNPANLNREVISSLTGVYTSSDRGETWRRLNDLPDEEFRTARFTANGAILASGIAGTFLVDHSFDSCSPRLIPRGK